MHLGARDYDPTLGRFLTADPVFEAKDPLQDNGYSYAVNNPVTGSDPSGLHTDDPRYGVKDTPSGYISVGDAGDGVSAPDATVQDPPASPGGSSSPTQHRSAWQNFMAGFVGLSKPEVSAAMQEAGGMQTAQNFQHGIPLDMAPAAQAATDNVYDCTQFLVCAAGSMASGLIGTGGLAGGGDALLERGGMSATERLLGADSAATASRGLSKYGGVFSSEKNAAGGTVWAASGDVSQNDFASLVNSGLMRGDVNIITGAHGAADGTTVVDRSLYDADVSRFGALPGVKVYNLPDMTRGQVSNLIQGPGTTIAGFCNSGACLVPFK